MSVSALGGALDTQKDLTQMLLQGPQQMMDQAMKVASAEMQMQMKAQEMAQTQQAVATLTGVGGNLNSVV